MFPVGDGANNIHLECNTQNNAIQSCNRKKCASWDVPYPSFKFCAPVNIQPTMINGLVPHCPPTEGSLISQFKEQNE